MKCPKCGKEIEFETAFCPDCGEKLSPDQQFQDSPATSSSQQQEKMTAEQMKQTIQNKTSEISRRATDAIDRMELSKTEKIALGCSFLATIAFLICITGKFVNWLLLIAALLLAYCFFKKKEYKTKLMAISYSFLTLTVILTHFDMAPFMIAVSVVYWLIIANRFYEPRLGPALMLLGDGIVVVLSLLNFFLSMNGGFRMAMFYFGLVCEMIAFFVSIYSDKEIVAFVKAIRRREIKLKSCFEPQGQGTQLKNVHYSYSEAYIKTGKKAVYLLIAISFLLICILNFIPAVNVITENSLLNYSGQTASSLLLGTESTTTYYETASMLNFWGGEYGIGIAGIIIGVIYTILMVGAVALGVMTALSPNHEKRNRALLFIANIIALAITAFTYLLLLVGISDHAPLGMRNTFAVLLVLICVNALLLAIAKRKFTLTSNI